MFCVPTGIWAIICLITWYYLFFAKESDKNIKKRIENFGVEKYKELEKIATELENGDLSLEDSVSKFEEGMKLSKQCNDLLENAEKRITILLKDGEETKEESFVQEEE